MPLPIPSGVGRAPSMEAAKEAFRSAWAQFYLTLTPNDIRLCIEHRIDQRVAFAALGDHANKVGDMTATSSRRKHGVCRALDAMSNGIVCAPALDAAAPDILILSFLGVQSVSS